MIFLTETKCKIRFIYVGFNCKRQKRGKKCLEIMTIKGGSGAGGLTPNGKTILNFHFNYLHPSLRKGIVGGRLSQIIVERCRFSVNHVLAACL